jgi:phosphoglycerate dehydrogenase-like enzyme
LANIVVTFEPQAGQKEEFTRILGSVGRVLFLSDLSPSDRARELPLADILISWSPARELQPAEFNLINRVRLLQLLSAGADHLPFSQLPTPLIIASNPGAYAEPMAEHILAMVLAATKNLIDRHMELRKGVFDQTKMNRMLHGSDCLILGFGSAGKAAARLLRCMGVKIYALNTSGRTEEAAEFIGTLKDLEHVLRLADIVIITLPLTKSTRRLIGKTQLAWMKDNAVLVNVARGEIIDEEALYEKLKAFPNFTAAIDAWWVEPMAHGKFQTNYPFLELPNMLGSPHNSGIVSASLINGTIHAAENVKRFLNNQPIQGIVNRSEYA